jgi:hypothetical protein
MTAIEMMVANIEAEGSWPPCADEFATIERCIEGYSLARYGDGELKLMYLGGYSREPGGPTLAAELISTLLTPDRKCIVGVPTMDKKGPKYAFMEPTTRRLSGWVRHRSRFIRLFERTTVKQYYSAFVTRPDSSPWIRTLDYAHLVERLWTDKNVVVMCEKANKSMLEAVQRKSRRMMHVSCPSHQAYRRIDTLEAKITDIKPDIAILSAGPTATCLANRLSAAGVHAIDLGSCGGWINELLKGEKS